MIPRRIHQVWLGPDDPPEDMFDSWRQLNPEYEHQVWREHHMHELGPVYDAYLATGRYSGAADVARAWILYREGGVYVDADTRCLRGLPEEWRTLGFWAGFEPTPHLGGLPLVGTSYVGAEAGHSIISAWIAENTQADLADAQTWRQTGPPALTRAILKVGGYALPAGLLYPVSARGVVTPGAWDPVAEHQFRSTMGSRVRA